MEKGDEPRAARLTARWGELVRRTWRAADRDNVFIVAGGVSFFAMLSLFPALIALISIYGLLADPTEVSRGLAALGPLLPADVYRILATQLRDIVSQSRASLSLGFLLSLGLSLWTASSGMDAIIKALNIAYDEGDSQSFVRRKARSVMLTLGGLLFIASNVLVAAWLPATLPAVGRAGLWLALAWPLVFADIAFGLSLLYHYGPNRARARFRWLSWGSAIATLLWSAASALLATYVAHFGKYQETYGTIAGLMVLLTWIYLTSLAVLLGAELDSEMEAHAARGSAIESGGPREGRGVDVSPVGLRVRGVSPREIGEAHARCGGRWIEPGASG